MGAHEVNRRFLHRCIGLWKDCASKICRAICGKYFKVWFDGRAPTCYSGCVFRRVEDKKLFHEWVECVSSKEWHSCGRCEHFSSHFVHRHVGLSRWLKGLKSIEVYVASWNEIASGIKCCVSVALFLFKDIPNPTLQQVRTKADK